MLNSESNWFSYVFSYWTWRTNSRLMSHTSLLIHSFWITIKDSRPPEAIFYSRASIASPMTSMPHLQSHQSIQLPWLSSPTSPKTTILIPPSLKYHPCPFVTLTTFFIITHLDLYRLKWSLGKVSKSSPQIHPPMIFSPNHSPTFTANSAISANSLQTQISASTSSQPCNRPYCKTCHIHHPVNSFTILNTVKVWSRCQQIHVILLIFDWLTSRGIK